jgi:hypothetical protein
MDSIYKQHISSTEDIEQCIGKFIQFINGKKLNDDDFELLGEKWLICKRPYTNSDDIIVDEKIAEDYDKYLLVKTGSDRTVIYGWCDRKLLMSTPARDLYRNGTSVFCVMDTNVQDLTYFKIPQDNLILKTEFIINAQQADNLGASEMISGILAGLHYFAKQAELYFKDINQKDEGVLGDKKFKIYTRDYLSDEDMLISDAYFLAHPEIDYYILCKIKGGQYKYWGYTTREVAAVTRIVQMTGSTEMDVTGEKIRRIFAEQYLNLNSLIKIYEEVKKEELIIIPQSYVPLHTHSEWSILDGYGTVKYITEILKKQGFKACALTDHGTLAGVWDFQKACLLQDIKPIIGSEFYISLPDEEKAFHLTLLVKNKTGWQNILKLQAYAVREGFHYRPVVPLEKIFELHEGLIILSGCMSGYFFKLLNNKEQVKAEALIKRFKEVFKEDFYIEIMPHAIENYQVIMEELYNLSVAFNIKCVLTTDSHYPLASDKKYHDAVKAIGLKKKYGEAGFDDDCFYLMQDADIENKIMEDASWMKELYKSFMLNTFEAADKCDFKIEPVVERDTLPRFEFDIETFKENEYFKDIISDFFLWKEKAKLNSELMILTNHEIVLEE